MARVGAHAGFCQHIALFLIMPGQDPVQAAAVGYNRPLPAATGADAGEFVRVHMLTLPAKFIVAGPAAASK
jgi:hypothetical protein